MKIFLFTILVLFSGAQVAIANLPAQPTEADHPGSAAYKYSFTYQTLSISGRKIDIYLPTGSDEKFPVLAFGHGQAIDASGYEETFKHLAKKGVVVIHPSFDNGFFDQDWRRMADDFNLQVSEVLKKYADIVDAGKIVYSGHSKGAYVSLMAMGAPSRKRYNLEVGSGVFFAPAGYDAAYLKELDQAKPITIFWSDKDTIIKKSLIKEIYANLDSTFKQWILVSSYQSLNADHFFPLSKSFFFGGKNGISPYHFHGSWKWLLGAVIDLKEGAKLTNSYIYGDLTTDSGIPEIKHKLYRNW